MNIIDKIKSLFGGGKKEYKSPFIIRTRVHPLRLKAKHNDNVILEITVKNVTDEDQLTSVRIKTNKWVGTDITTLKKDNTDLELIDTLYLRAVKFNNYDFSENDVVHIKGVVGEYKRKNKIDVNEDDGLIEITQEYNQEDFVPKTDKDIEKMWVRL